MKEKFKVFIFGLIIGGLVAFPLGINFGRDAPLFTNPFAARDVQQKFGEKMKEGTGKVTEKLKEGTEKAKEKIHEATKPAGEKLEQD